MTSGKSSISDVWQGFEPNFVLIIFAKLLPIIWLTYSIYIKQYSIVHGQILVTLYSTYLLHNVNYNSVS